MLVLISPAKNLDFSPLNKDLHATCPVFLNETEKLVKKLKKLKPSDFSTLMHLSPKLSELNYERYQNFHFPFLETQSKEAVFAFNGEVYNGLDSSSFTDENLQCAQNQLRILSGLYGVLKPLDRILPYRLEMGTKFKYSDKITNLYQFWDSKITKELAQTIKDHQFSYVVNLASSEYFKSVRFNDLKKPVITPVFKDFQSDGSAKVIMMYAKNARGKMARFIIQNKINNIEDLKSFDDAGYAYNDALSQNNEWVFTR